MEKAVKNWELSYDEENDVLYVSFGKPRPAISRDIDDVIVRFDEETEEVVGFTVVGLKRATAKHHIKVPIQTRTEDLVAIE